MPTGPMVHTGKLAKQCTVVMMNQPDRRCAAKSRAVNAADTAMVTFWIDWKFCVGFLPMKQRLAGLFQRRS